MTHRSPSLTVEAPSTVTWQCDKVRLQSLLAQRFSLVVHTGTTPMQAYVLSAPKGKANLKQSDGTDDFGCKGQPMPANQSPGAVPQITVACHNETMEQFAEFLHMIRGGGATWMSENTKPLVDSTGLKGGYDFDFKWTPSGALIESAGTDYISIPDAVDKQLGLKLTRETAPVPVLIVDSVNETPTPNPSDLAKRMPPLPPPQFEVATIKPSKPDERGMFRFQGDQITVQNTTLKSLLQTAWDLDPYDRELLVGAPKWLDEDHFDILAKLSADTSNGAPAKPQALLFQQMREMLRTLIEDRFQMKFHWEDRPVTAYHLIAVSPKLTPADPRARTLCVEGPGADGKDPRLADPVIDRLVTCQNMTMPQLGMEFQSFAGGMIYRTVVDDTGLKGSYNFTLSFSSIQRLQGGGAPPPDGAQQAGDPSGAISLYDAIKSQLGLRLEKQVRPMPVFVIDRIEEQPTAN